jgi:hypothetical protein
MQTPCPTLQSATTDRYRRIDLPGSHRRLPHSCRSGPRSGTPTAAFGRNQKPRGWLWLVVGRERPKSAVKRGGFC